MPHEVSVLRPAMDTGSTTSLIQDHGEVPEGYNIYICILYHNLIVKYYIYITCFLFLLTSNDFVTVFIFMQASDRLVHGTIQEHFLFISPGKYTGYTGFMPLFRKPILGSYLFSDPQQTKMFQLKSGCCDDLRATHFQKPPLPWLN